MSAPSSPLKFADIGVNLTDKRFAKDREAVLERARAARVQLQILTGTNLEHSQQALTLAEQEPDLFATVGLHPHQASDFSESLLRDLRTLLQHSKAAAVGEAGLDFNRDFSPRPQQELAFEAQLALGVELGKPVFLHQRDAHERFLPILKQFRDSLSNVVVHCFTDNRKALFDYLDLDCHIGITGWICDETRGKELQALVKNIPDHRLMIETDSPWLFPKSLGIKMAVNGRNEPAMLPAIASSIAKHREQPLEHLAHHCWNNSVEFFIGNRQNT